jgi:dTDP-4-amino-4,6-dideoxygalactose transaminase
MLMDGSLIKGKHIQEFESEFARIYGAKSALSVSSCRSAFSLMIDALGIVKGDEVILPAYNLPAFPKILKYKGIKPVFVDIDPQTLTIDAGQIEKNITPRTKAIIAVHLFGNVCDMERIVPIARKHNLPIIEDCANSFLTKYRGGYVGTYGHAACFSFGHSKDVPTFGGGMIITNDGSLHKNMQRIHDSEFTSPGKYEMIAMLIKTAVFKVLTTKVLFLLFVYPFVRLFAIKDYDVVGHFVEEKDKMITKISKKRFTNYQALVGIERLKGAGRMQQQRIKHAQYMDAALSGLDRVSAPRIIEGGSHAYWNYPVLADDRSNVLKRLIRHGIDGKKIDAYNCAQFEIFKEFERDCPVSNRISNKVVALPMYHYLKEEDVRFMGQVLAGGDEQ